MDNITLKGALIKSLEMEKAGFAFYMDTAKKTSNKGTAAIFKALAEDENRHIGAIKKYSDSASKNLNLPELSNAMPKHKDIKERVIFGKEFFRMLSSSVSGADQLKAYEAAMTLETEGYNFYKKAYNSIGDKNVKDLYKFLMGEENTHHKLISDTYEYLKNPQDLFFKNEKPIIEG